MKNAKNELLQFLAGVAMLTVGLFIFSQKVIVSSSFMSGFHMGGISMTSGMVIIPLIAGIVWMFVSGASFPSKVLTVLGGLLIIVGVIVSTRIYLTTMTLYDWILILVLIFGGAGLLVKVLVVGDYGDDDDNRFGYRERKTVRRQNRTSGYSKNSDVTDIEKELEEIKKGHSYK